MHKELLLLHWEFSEDYNRMLKIANFTQIPLDQLIVGINSICRSLQLSDTYISVFELWKKWILENIKSKRFNGNRLVVKIVCK